MSWLPDLLAAGSLAVSYGFVVVAILLGLRGFGLPTSGRLALAPVLAQATLSLALQCGLLAGSTALAGGLAAALVTASLLWIIAHHRRLKEEIRGVWAGLRPHLWIILPLGLLLLYSLAQCLALPVRNYDALKYHLPRVFLFMQADSFFLDSFNRYHQAVFPVGADILFLPYVALGLRSGLAIFSLSSYLSIGFAAFTIARHYGSPKNSALCALLVLSLTQIVLQSTSVKNDILMAAVAGCCLMIALRLQPRPDLPKVLFLGILTAYGISVKATFLAFLPGLACLLLLQVKPWNIARIREWTRTATSSPFPVLSTLIASLVLSNIWLFVWNHYQYGAWSGPSSFTYRHEQHDGLLGGGSNLIRYGLQILQGTYLSDVWLSSALDQSPFSVQLTLFYRANIEPLIGSLGATREAFGIYWLHDENFAWFGPIGAIIFFVCMPYALIRHPARAWPALLPAIGFFLIIALKISWMPWNGRFFSAFFISLVPAVALSLSGLREKRLRGGLIGIALILLSIVKLTDFSNPIWLPSLPPTAATPAYVQFTEKAAERSWKELLRMTSIHEDEPLKLVSNLPAGSRVGLYTNGHRMSYHLFHSRPDLEWIPLDRIRGEGEIEILEAVSIFLRSEIGYLLVLNAYSPAWKEVVWARSPDGSAVILKNPNLL